MVALDTWLCTVWYNLYLYLYYIGWDLHVLWSLQMLFYCWYQCSIKVFFYLCIICLTVYLKYVKAMLRYDVGTWYIDICIINWLYIIIIDFRNYIQTFLFQSGSNLGDTQFLYIDLLITTTVAFLMGHTHAYHKLVYQRPKGGLLSFSSMFALFSQIILMAIIQVAAYIYLNRQYW